MGTTGSRRGIGPWLISTAVLTLIVGFIFLKSFGQNQVFFANDGPLGVVASQAMSTPEVFSGFWMDAQWIGVNGTHGPASVTYGLLWLLGPVGFAKFYPALAILFCGLAAFVFFRALGLGPALATVGAIGAALNSNFFSNTCWGLGTRSIALGCIFLALAALSTRRAGNPWLNAILAGMAVGVAVVEAADNGVIFSLFVAAFVAWQTWVGRKEPAGAEPGNGGLFRGITRLALVAAFAGFMATQSLISLFDIASKGAVTSSAPAETQEFKWLFASQWSLPPNETIRVLIPGLYGYRMDTPDGGNYWGRVGETPGSTGTRFSGAGEYAGVLVVLLSIWSLAQVFRRNGSPFTKQERQMMGFWGVVLVVSVVLAWGKYTPLYRLTVYQLPYFSSIRNPMKFMHVTHMALMILFGYGLLGLSRQYLQGAKSVVAAVKTEVFDRRWKWALIACAAASAVYCMAYWSNQPGLEKHLASVGFDGTQGPTARRIASFSAGEVGKFVLFTMASAGALLLVMRGTFAGPRAIWGSIALGLILTVDLVRANAPWVIYWDYKYKYASNPIIDILKDKPYQARIVAPMPLIDPRALQPAGGVSYLFRDLYTIEWVQHHFQYFNIQSVDVSQDPRPPADKQAYLAALQTPTTLARYWQLTNTRYVLGASAFLNALNQQFDPEKKRFRIRSTFDVVAKPGVTPSQMQDFTAVAANNGPLSLFEFTGALPRARLYARWQVSTNGDEALKTLADPAFDPWSSVVISDQVPASPSVITNAEGGTVEFASYSPQRIELKANATTASMLLLNDRFDKDWRVKVDGQPARLLRANFIMRGVEVPAGAHTVLFEFRPPLKGLYVSLVATAVGLVLCGVLFVVRQPESPAAEVSRREPSGPNPKNRNR